MDRFVTLPDGRKAILECKTAHYDMQFKWANGAVPRHYELQVRHYMSVMNIDVAFIACLFSNNENDFVWQKIERDLEEEENTIMELSAFWNNHVMARVEPPLVEKPDAVLESLRRYFGPADKSEPTVDLDRKFVVNLKEILTLKEEKRAFAINHNDTHLQFGDDFQFLEVQNSEEAAQLVIKNYLQEVSLHGIEDVQILSPLRKRGAVAANALNETIRDLVNPPNNLKKEVKCGSRVFRVGDRIMQTANRINVSNGDVGVITDMKKEDDETITCVRLLDGRTLQYTQEMLEDLEFSYCTTIHKSQGQEYPVIIVPLLKEHYIMLRRNLLYTAVTRAKAKVILIGQKQAVFVAIHKCDVGQRNTVLADRIVAYYNRELSRRVA